MKLAVLATILAAFILSIGFYSHLPARLPVHWNVSGEVDNDAPRAIGAFLMPLIMLGLVGLFAALPSISPRGYPIEGRSRAYQAILLAVVLFLFGIHVQMLLSSVGVRLSVSLLVTELMGGLFVVLGNYMPKFKRNFFVGIRTPWTLADENVWYRTHRLGGVTFVVGGVLMMAIGPFLPRVDGEVLILSAIVPMTLIPVIYSFAIARRGEAEAGKGEFPE